MKVKGILKVLKEINTLKKRGLIKDYAIGGAIAKNYYLEPQFTYDLDVFILIETMGEFHDLYAYFRQKKCKIENVFIVLHGVPVQFLPSLINPLIAEAIKKGRKIKIDGTSAKVLSAEHLIATLLMSFRQKDKYAITELVSFAKAGQLKKILNKFSTRQYPLWERFRTLGVKA